MYKMSLCLGMFVLVVVGNELGALFQVGPGDESIASTK